MIVLSLVAPRSLGSDGEVDGIVIPPTDVQGNAVRYSNMSFGQGMNVTMAQVAAGFSAIVNGGTYRQPTVIEGLRQADGAITPLPNQTNGKEQVIKAATSKTVRKMTVKARKHFMQITIARAMKSAAKQAHRKRLIDGSYDNNQTVGTYLGFGGDTEPKYVIMVQVAGEGLNLSGGEHANPIFTEISNWMIDYKGLQPKGLTE